MAEVFAGLSMMPEEGFRESAYPLFEEGIVDWIEWTFDMGWSKRGIPSWLQGLLAFYGGQGRLSGHGVQYSALSGKWTTRHDAWLENLKREVGTRQYIHISEHFGYARAADYSFSAPLPVPLCKQAVDIGRENLERIHQITKGPVGLENLALAFGTKDVEAQGHFLDALVAPIDGFLVLDIHNIHCQSMNFGIPVLELIKSYPLDRVLEIHISGGSFSTSMHGYTDKPIRRDTHDGPVPSELYTLLPKVLKLCPNAQVVILERIGDTFSDKKTIKEFANEFRTLKNILKDVNKERVTTSGSISTENGTRSLNRGVPQVSETSDPQVNETSDPAGLYELQCALHKLLEDGRDAVWVKEELKRDPRFNSFNYYIDSMEPRMLEVGQELMKKWGVKN